MRSHAKARPIGSILLVFFALLVTAAPAPAAMVTDRPVLFSFNGSDTTKGAFTNPKAIDIDLQSGTVYVVDGNSNHVLDKFNLAGQAQNFEATGQSSLALGFNLTNRSDVAIDNSAANPGRIYVSKGGSPGTPIKAFNPQGSLVWEMATGEVGEACGTAIDGQGRLYVAGGESGSGSSQIMRFSSTGSPPALETSFPATRPCRLGVDQAGQTVYATDFFGNSNAPLNKFVGGVFDSVLTSEFNTTDVAVDRSTPAGRIFTVHNTGTPVREFDSTGKELAAYSGTGTLSQGLGIAYHPALDRIYVADNAAKHIKVLGPPVPGVVPDVTIDPVESNSITTAEFSGTVNALGLENSYRFEYKKSGSSTWLTTPLESITPSDSDIHVVSASVGGLEGNEALYNVRLRATNTTTGFASFSEELNFKTGKKPTLTFDQPSAVTGSSAHLSGSIDPGDSEAEWGFQLSKSSNCLLGEGFSNGLNGGSLPANSGVVIVEEEATDLLPSQDYCVRLAAVNNRGVVESEIKTFTTADLEPEASVFAAPITDKTARLNASYNPNGANLIYRFEYSADGGETWVAFADQEDTSESTNQTVISQELTGLEPDATYDYRFLIENGSGERVVQKKFTTRSSSEMFLLDRGIELVNNPEKGNQNVLTSPVGEEEAGRSEAALSPNGRHAAWYVKGGAPGATTGNESVFLASRSPLGWTSKSLVPSAENQYQGGNLRFAFAAASPDFSRSVFTGAEGINTGASSETSVVRNNGDSEQELLVAIQGGVSYNDIAVAVDASRDMEHVLFALDTGVLRDFGTGTEEVVGLMDDGQQPPCKVGDLSQGAYFEGFYNGGPHWIATTDASRVYFRTRGSNCSAPLGLYVRNRDEGTTTQLAGSAKFLRTSANGRAALFATPEKLAAEDLNSSFDIYRYEEQNGGVFELDADSDYADSEKLASGPSYDVAVDSDSGDVYLVRGTNVVPYSDGEAGAAFAEEGSPPVGVAFDGSSGKAYVSKRSDEVAVFSDQGSGLTLETTFTCSATNKCGPAAEFSSMNAGRLALNEQSGDVYVIDEANNAVHRFSEAGQFLSTLTAPFNFQAGARNDIAIDNSEGPNQGNVYVGSEKNGTGRLFAFNPAGSLLWQSTEGLKDLCGVGVDSSGTPWTSDYYDGVQRRNVAIGATEGAPVSSEQACEIAFDEDDDLLTSRHRLAECLSCSVPNASVKASLSDQFEKIPNIRTSADLSRTYFTSAKQLVPGEGQIGAENLYLQRSDGSIGFVAVIEGGVALPPLGYNASRMTPDGRVLLFSSTTRPTTDSVAASCLFPTQEEGGTGHDCGELYRYDDADRSIECISCDQDGVTTWDWGGETGLALSQDGDTAAFVTNEALVEQDVNKAADVYEWRNGVQRLITDGETKFSAASLQSRPMVRGIDMGGDSILFSAAAGPLTGYEQDDLANLYVARVGGGFPRPVPPLHCAEDSCQGALVAPPASPSQASSGYSGRGNLAPQTRKRRPCARKRGKAKRTCLKRQRARANAKARGSK